MKAETKFAKKVDAKLADIPRSYWFTIQQSSIRGDPDRVGVVNGIFVALELKSSRTAKRAKLQEYKIDQINRSGGLGRFVYPENLEDVMKEIRML